MRSKTDRLYRLWALAAVYFCLVLAFYGVSFWLPQILQQLSHYRRASSRSSLPCRTSLGPWAWSSSAPGRNPTGERRWHVAGAALLGAAGFAAPATVPPSVVLSITTLSVAAFGLCGAMGPFWSLPTAFLRGRAAAGARRVTAGRTEPRWRA